VSFLEAIKAADVFTILQAKRPTFKSAIPSTRPKTYKQAISATINISDLQTKQAAN